ncbi:hemagglutinin repeat-containing protein [Pandoraea pneumonica]|uniref:hemagglutinin repeat-containing protein n=1 Tax=Pandoraea pneumonica TaxID=2508299 RepID=UPI003CF62E27
MVGATANAGASRRNTDDCDVTNNYSHIPTDSKTTVVSRGGTTVKGSAIAGLHVMVNVAIGGSNEDRVNVLLRIEKSRDYRLSTSIRQSH